MTLFVVVKMGVYMQGIVGVFDSYDTAEVCAKQFLEEESDDYHTAQIYRIFLNHKHQIYDDCGMPIPAGEVVAKLKRDSGVVSIITEGE